MTSRAPTTSKASGRTERKRHRHRPTGDGAKKVAIRCRHCDLRYNAIATDAICPKCKCPANRPLDMRSRYLCCLIPPVGFIRAALLWTGTPLAAMQALQSGVIGSAGYLVLWFVLSRLFMV